MWRTSLMTLAGAVLLWSGSLKQAAANLDDIAIERKLRDNLDHFEFSTVIISKKGIDQDRNTWVCGKMNAKTGSGGYIELQFVATVYGDKDAFGHGSWLTPIGFGMEDHSGRFEKFCR